MLENTVHWRRDYKPDELDPDYIKPEVSIYLDRKRGPFVVKDFFYIFGEKNSDTKTFIRRLKLVKCILMGLTSVAVLCGL